MSELSLKEKLALIKEEAKKRIFGVENPNDLNTVKSEYLGKKGPMQEILAHMREYSDEEKRTVGQMINEFKKTVEEAVNDKIKDLEQKAILKKLNKEAIDVTLPGKEIASGTMHPLSRVVKDICELCIGMGYTVAEGPEVELDLYNFELLNLPKGHPARAMQDTFYINPEVLLRSQTSPVQARTMLESNGKPIKIICPGKVYRRDSDDATHSHQFMQIEGLVIGENITLSDLKGTLSLIMKKMFGDERVIRFRPSYFPFTEPSVEVDVSCFKCGGKGCALCKGNGWIEVLGAGMVHPNVLKMCGYDPEKYQGFAFGMGVERIAMLRYGIDDIRIFYINDERFLKQF